MVEAHALRLPGQVSAGLLPGRLFLAAFCLLLRVAIADSAHLLQLPDQVSALGVMQLPEHSCCGGVHGYNQATLLCVVFQGVSVHHVVLLYACAPHR